MNLFIPIGLALASVCARGQGFPPATPESQGLAPEQVARLDRTVQKYVQDQSIVGAELLVVKNRKTVLHKAYGFRDKESGEKMEIGTIFNIRSMTKSLTGAAVQVLIEEGKIGLNDKVSKHLSEFDTDTAREITVHHLLSHRSGLPLTVMTRLDEYKDLAGVAAAAAAAALRFAPGEPFFYSDAGTDCLAALIERVSGQTVDKFVASRLLEPLGMDDSFYVWDEAKKDRLASLYGGVRGDWSRIWDASKQFYPFAWGSQTLYSTPVDYAKFLAMWMDSGEAGGKRLLSKSTLERGLSPVSEMMTLGGGSRMPTGYFDLAAYYGEMAQLWFREPLTAGAKPVAIGHSGSDGTMGWAWPAEDLIVCFFTQSRGMSGTLRIETVIDATLLGKDTVPVPEAFKPYLGTYLANFSVFQNEEFEVQFINGRLALDIPSQLTFPLDGPNEEGRFTVATIPGQSFSFSDPKDGLSEKMTVHAGPQQVDLPRGKAPAVKRELLKIEDVRKFLGKYLVPEDGSKVEVFFQSGALKLRIESNGMEVSLIPVKEQPNVWLLNGSLPLEFQEEGGEIVSFTATLPDGTKITRTKVKGSSLG